MLITTAMIAALLSNPFAAKPAPAATPAPAAAPQAAAAPVVDVPPRGFPAYAHPDVTPTMCKMVNASQAQCVIPAMTAGRYLVEAAGTSTANPVTPPTPPAKGAPPAKPQGPVQALTIVTGDKVCGQARTNEPWTGVHTLKLNCELMIVADTPFVITVVYGDANATKDPRGPSLLVHRLPWDGVVSSQAFLPQQ
jgi:hypothetical protein